ncbi:RodZ domain-containing protein [Marinomonas sp. 5E14-1]|uniref:RodZ domain-containing protein n=1 Tax=Marinomonas sp. 5E14-1 TaxID=3153922 RepID=UPI0032642788
MTTDVPESKKNLEATNNPENTNNIETTNNMDVIGTNSNITTDEKIDTLNDTDATESDLTIGQTLKAKRTELGLTEQDIATSLKISLDQVKALEANNFDHFLSVAFARGFLKSYCRVVGLNQMEILDVFDSNRDNKESTIKPVDKVNTQTHLGDPIVTFISVVIVAVLVFLVFWWPSESAQSVIADENPINETAEIAQAEEPLLNSDTFQSSVQNEGDVTEPVLTPDASQSSVQNEGDVTESVLTPDTSQSSVQNEGDVTESVLTPDTSQSSVQNEGGVAEADDTANSAPSTLVEVASESESNVVTGLFPETVAILKDAGVSPDKVVKATQVVPAPEPVGEKPSTPTYTHDVDIAFAKDCWTEIRDASGRILFSGVKTAGQTLKLSGNAPYRVVLGYARGVSSLKYKGEEFAFSSFIRQDLARFELK